MPRIKPSPAEQRRQTFRSIMRYNADRMGLTTDEKTAKYLGISPQLYSYRMRHLSAWSYEDLCNIFKKLRFSQSDIEEMFKN